MKVIHVLRKPCLEPTVAANVLTYGAGAIHIDACRIAISASDRAAYDDNMRCHERYADGRNKLGGYDGGWRADPTSIQNKGARWPANLVLQHLPECKQDGTRQVKAITGGAFSGDNALGQDSGWNKHNNRSTNIQRFGDPDGTETVSAWTCSSGCPVADLDAQSGVSKSVERKPTGQPIYPTEGSAMVWNSNSVMDLTERGFSDVGGASRFFKQIKS